MFALHKKVSTEESLHIQDTAAAQDFDQLSSLNTSCLHTISSEGMVEEADVRAAYREPMKCPGELLSSI